MSGGSILALIGAIVALLGPIALPFITIDEEEVVIRSFQTISGMASLAAALITAGLAFLIWKKRKRNMGLPIAIISLVQIALMGWTYNNVWNLTPCASLGLSLCDETTGGLIDQTLVTLDWGVVLVVLASILSFFGGLIALASFDEYTKDQRFLRVMLTWNGHIVVERVFFKAQAITVGEKDANTFQLAANGLDSHTLFTPVAGSTDKYTLTIPNGIGGKLTVGGNTKDASGTVEVSRGDAGLLNFDNGVDVAFQFTGAEAGALISAGAGRDVGLAVSFASVAAVFLVLMAGMFTANSKRDRAKAEEAIEEKARSAIEVAIEDKIIEEEKEEPEGDEEDQTGKKAGGEEGKFGDPDTDPNKTSKVPKMDGPMRDKIDVKNIGMAKLLGGPQAMSGAIGQIMAGDTGAISSKMAVAMSGEGSELVIGAGSGGMGFRGTGSGGGGDGLGRIQGLGSIDTGGGTGRNANMGIGRKSTKKVAKLNIAQGSSTGGCDKGDISKNVRARAAAIRACYETQLLSKPDLAGKLTVQWTITGDGSVSSDKITADSINNNAVSDCVQRAIRRIRFAKPEAGVCVISWPFVFSPG